MASMLKRAWWTLLLRGVVAILFALLILFSPGLTLTVGAFSFAVLFGLYALVDGVGTIIGAVMRREGQWVWLLILGIVSVIAGLAALGNPLLFSAVTVQIMIYLFAFKSISGGVVELIGAWQLRQEIDNEWLLALNGLFSIFFGIILIARPIVALEVLITLAAFYLLMTGGLLIALGFRMRGWSGKLQDAKAA